MTAALTIWANDLRSVVRDRTVGALFAVPVMFLILLRIGMPILNERLPAAAGYAPVIVGMAVTIAGMIPAFMLAFLMLDERDQGLFPAFQILPIAPGRLLSYRLASIAALGYLSAFMLILNSKVVPVSPGTALALAVPCALVGPAATLIAIALAKNKIEGLAVFKGLFFLLALGAPGGMPLPADWLRITGVVPTYWIFYAIAHPSPAPIAIATILHGAVMTIAYLAFRRRIY